MTTPEDRTMDLILWRHAEAQEHPDGIDGRQGDEKDMARRLTPKGEKQALRMARWLDRQLPQGTRIFVSPAQRTEQTAAALGRKVRIAPVVAPEGDPAALLELAQWPNGRSPCLIVGHQPTLGQVVARLLNLRQEDCAIRKGAVWWLRHRQRGGQSQTVILTVQTPELL